MLSLKQGAPQLTLTDQSPLPGILDPLLQTNNRMNYEDVDPLTEVTCATHAYSVQDKDSPQMWGEIIVYLKNDTLLKCCEDLVKRKLFIQRTKGFFLHDGNRLWKIESQGKLPCLVVVDVEHRSALVAEEVFTFPGLFCMESMWNPWNECWLRPQPISYSMDIMDSMWNEDGMINSTWIPHGFHWIPYGMQASPPWIPWKFNSMEFPLESQGNSLI